ncbi:MAG: aminotransferase class IV [Tepidisphaeraceae bacterium]|jgi:branched-chain amino acid aminotransferase
MSDLWLNGGFAEESTASIPLRDTGLLHAAGVFTTLRADRGNVFRLDQHLQRLRHSCEALFIPLQYSDDVLRQAVREILRRNQLADARLRLTVTRGAARHDPVHGLRLEPTVFLTATHLEPYPGEYYEKGMTVIVLDEQKLNPYDIQAGHKTLNYFSRLSALRAANSRGAGEALWFNVHNYLESGSISNVFVVKDKKLLTPPTPADLNDPAVAAKTPYPKSAALPGVTRQAMLELAAAAQVEVQIRALSINDLLDADECFLTNSIMRLMPVCRIERRALGQDKPGEITRKLTDAFSTLAETL